MCSDTARARRLGLDVLAAGTPATAGPSPGVMPHLRPITLVAQVFDAIVQAAAEGRFLPGDRVVEADIARELRVSRMPVREALRLLESQGIMVNTPYKGMHMMEVDAGHLHNILVVRVALEKMAALRAAKVLRRDAASAALLDAMLADMRKAVRERSGFAFARADTAFHRALCRLSGNDVLLQIWEGLAHRLTIIIGLSTLERNLEGIYQEHVRLAEVLRRGTRRDIEREVNEHIIRQTESVDFERLIAARHGTPKRLAKDRAGSRRGTRS
jgi:DNA-binding GntR family transcriptional regulator